MTHPTNPTSRSMLSSVVIPELAYPDGRAAWTFSQTIADIDPASWGGILT